MKARAPTVFPLHSPFLDCGTVTFHSRHCVTLGLHKTNSPQRSHSVSMCIWTGPKAESFKRMVSSPGQAGSLFDFNFEEEEEEEGLSFISQRRQPLTTILKGTETPGGEQYPRMYCQDHPRTTRMEHPTYLSGSHNSGYPVILVSVTSRVHKS